MAKNLSKKIVLENGLEFAGELWGADRQAVGEIVFNTSMVGYQEIISDPAYSGQIVVMTYPLIGQYGITDEDSESKASFLAGLVTREYCDTPSNFRFTKTAKEELEEHGIPAVQGLDTRMLTRIIRDNGPMKAAIVNADMPVTEALELIASTPAPAAPAEKVSCTKRWFRRTPNHKYDVVVVDCGLKHSIVSCLNVKGCNVTVVPFGTGVDEILSFNPDGVLISSGPGDPRELGGLVETVRALIGKLPVCGVALGQEIICMAYGAGITTLKVGHHGGRPVRNLETGAITIVEHNHGYAVDRESLGATPLQVTCEDVCDHTVEGVKCEEDKVLCCQYYPEGAPGPRDEEFFDRFVSWMEKQ